MELTTLAVDDDVFVDAELLIPERRLCRRVLSTDEFPPIDDTTELKPEFEPEVKALIRLCRVVDAVLLDPKLEIKPVSPVNEPDPKAFTIVERTEEELPRLPNPSTEPDAKLSTTDVKLLTSRSLLLRPLSKVLMIELAAED